MGTLNTSDDVLWRVHWENPEPTFEAIIGGLAVRCEPWFGFGKGFVYSIAIDNVVAYKNVPKHRVTDLAEYVAKAWLLGLPTPKELR